MATILNIVKSSCLNEISTSYDEIFIMLIVHNFAEDCLNSFKF